MRKRASRRRNVEFLAATRPDYDQLKTRTVIALDRLGHQRFSPGSGGYSIENWMRGVNLLLDDFEGKIGTAKIPPEYFEKRRELNRLSGNINLTPIDDRLAELRQSEAEVVRRLNEARTQTTSRIRELQNELARCSAELEKKRKLLNDTAEKRAESYFKRLFGGSLAPADSALENRVKELESRLRILPIEVLKLQDSLKSIDRRSSTSPWASEWKKLESVQVRLQELENEKMKRAQLVREREEITASIADAISSVEISEN
jgi:hypothetical protein